MIDELMTPPPVTTIPIVDGYEWIQYNEELKLIHSIKDDMYQAASIVRALGKNPKNKPMIDWLANEQTKELFAGFEAEMSRWGIPHLGSEAEMSSRGIPLLVENRSNAPNGVRGYYIHRLLINFVAMWASPKYAYRIALLLDNVFEEQRKTLSIKIDQLTTENDQLTTKNDQLKTQKEKLKPRTVS
jgi:hypothetical protein